jgi:hypothetical protein
MSETAPETLGERFQAGEDDLLVVDIPHGGDRDDRHIPDSAHADVDDGSSENSQRTSGIVPRTPNASGERTPDGNQFPSTRSSRSRCPNDCAE